MSRNIIGIPIHTGSGIRIGILMITGILIHTGMIGVIIMVPGILLL